MVNFYSYYPVMSNYHKDEEKPIHPDSLLKTEEILTIPLGGASQRLCLLHGKDLEPNPEGIYIFNTLHPVLLPGQIGYLKNGKTVNFTDILKYVDEDVFNENGILKIPGKVLQNKSKLINQSGFFPISALQLLKHNVDKNLQSFCPHSVPFTSAVSYDRYLKKSAEDLIANGVCDSVLELEIPEIHEFIYKDLWRIYFVKTKTNNLFIEKSIDFRIYDWTKMKYEEYCKNVDEDQ